MIVFDSTTWTISLPPGESPIARQYDNLTRSIVISGVPDGWAWTLLVQASGKLDLIQLEPVEGGVGVNLTAQMLALSGFYTIQLRGTQGDLVRHTNVLQVLVPKSLSGSATWPTVPSAVEQVLQQTAELNSHPPYPGDNGYWMVWDLDTHAYVESQLPLPPVAEGPAGKAATITVGETITGEPGTPASVVNTGTESAAVLNFTISQGQQGNPGAAATVAVGETVTGTPGTEASVENVGTSSAAVLRFTIPAGATGATPDISVEVTGLPEGSEPTVSVSGTPEAPVISLGIPAGKKGDPGDPGQTPNIEIGSVETLPAGSSVTASITGQTPNLVLNLGIPQGQQGDHGAGVPSTEGVPDNYVLTPIGWAAPTGGDTAGDLELVASATLEEAVDVISLDLEKPCTEVIAVLTPYGDDSNQDTNTIPYMYAGDGASVELKGLPLGIMKLKSNSAMVYAFRAARFLISGNLVEKTMYEETGAAPTGITPPDSQPWNFKSRNWEIVSINALQNIRLQLWGYVWGVGTKLEIYGR